MMGPISCFARPLLCGIVLTMSVERVGGEEDSRAQPPTRVTVTDLAKVFKERQASIQSAEFKWLEYRLEPAAAFRDTQQIPKSAEGLSLPVQKDNADVPEARAPAECEFYVSGVMMRHNSELATSRRHGEDDRETIQSAFDGKQRVSLARPGSGDLLGTIYKTVGTSSIANSAAVLPLMCAIKPLHPMVMPLEALENAKLSETHEDIRGHRCLRITQEKGAVHRGIVREMFVDVDRDFVVIKCVDTPDDGSIATFEIDYQPSDEVGWQPVSWSWGWGGPSGDFSHGAKSTLQSSRFNMKIPAETFTIDFPPGTHVSDARTGRRFYVPGEGSER